MTPTLKPWQQMPPPFHRANAPLTDAEAIAWAQENGASVVYYNPATKTAFIPVDVTDTDEYRDHLAEVEQERREIDGIAEWLGDDE